MKQRLLSEISGTAIPLMAFSVALNLTAGQITTALKIPIYLDSIGTILVAVLVGPWAASLTGTLSNVMAAGIGNPMMMFFIPVTILIGIFSAFVAKLGWFRKWYLCILGGLIQGMLAATISAPIAAYVFGGTMMAGTDFLVLLFRSTGHTLLQSTFLQGLMSDPIDKTISYLIVFFLLNKLPQRIVTRFKGAPNIITPQAS